MLAWVRHAAAVEARQGGGRRPAAVADLGRVLDCRCCARPVHLCCDKEREEVGAKVAEAALAAQQEAAAVAASLHLGFPAAADQPASSLAVAASG